MFFLIFVFFIINNNLFSQQKSNVRISGKVTNYDCHPLKKAIIFVMNDRYPIYHKTSANNSGEFSFLVNKGTFSSLAFVKEYSNKYIEYTWNFTASKNIHLNARIDEIEIFAIDKEDSVHNLKTAMIHFRPMIICDNALLQNAHSDTLTNELTIKEFRVLVNEIPVKILSIIKVNEYSEDGKYIHGYIMKIQLPRNLEKCDHTRVCISILDAKRNKENETCISWSRGTSTMK